MVIKELLHSSVLVDYSGKGYFLTGPPPPPGAHATCGPRPARYNGSEVYLSNHNSSMLDHTPEKPSISMSLVVLLYKDVYPECIANHIVLVALWNSFTISYCVLFHI